MIPDLPEDIDDIKGFLSEAEGEALYRHALAAATYGPILEVGSYCGKSTIYLGLACKASDACVYALDHHRGSEEHQAGEFFHDPALFDTGSGQMDSFREFRSNIDRAGLTDVVIPIVAGSEQASKHWQTPLGMVFIDGGHSLDAALTDYRCWAPQIRRGGTLAIHDIYDDAYSGGQAPYAIHRLALESGLFEKVERVDSLVILKRF